MHVTVWREDEIGNIKEIGEIGQVLWLCLLIIIIIGTLLYKNEK